MASLDCAIGINNLSNRKLAHVGLNLYLLN